MTAILCLGIFLRMATESLENWQINNERYITLNLDGVDIRFTQEQLDYIFQMVRGVFYRNYGGWQIEIDYNAERMYSGKVSFVPAG